MATTADAAGRGRTPAAAPTVVIDDPADQPVTRVEYKGLLTLGIMAATTLQILDTTIANVALPKMQASLGATQDSISWVLTSYIVASAVAIPLTGWLSDRVGPRLLFLVSVATFVLASMLCGLSTSLAEIVLFRMLQGVSGAFIAPLGQSLLLDINRKSDHPRAMSIFGMGIMIGPIAGPIIGGWLTENFDWRWVFFVNVPVGVLCFSLLWWLLPKRPVAEPRRFDMLGFALIGIAVAAFQLVLDRGEHVDWFSSTEIWIELGAAAACLWMFVVHLATARNPLYPPQMLRDRNIVTGGLFMLIMGMVMMSVMALLPSMLQSLFGYSVLDTGVLLSTRGIGVLVSMLIVARVAKLVDLRLLIGSGFAIASVSLWDMTGWSLDMDWRPVVLSGLIQGLGLGMVFTPLQLLAFATLPSQFRTEGAAFISLMRNVGASVGIAVTTALLARNIQVSHSDLAEHITADRLSIDPSTATALGGAGDLVMAYLNAEVSRQAAMIAYIDDFKVILIASILVIPMAWLLRRPTMAVRASDEDEPALLME